MQSTFNTRNHITNSIGRARVSSSHMWASGSLRPKLVLLGSQYIQLILSPSELINQRTRNWQSSTKRMCPTKHVDYIWLWFWCGGGCQNSFQAKHVRNYFVTWGDIIMCWQKLMNIHSIIPEVLILFDACVKTALLFLLIPPISPTLQLCGL